MKKRSLFAGLCATVLAVSLGAVMPAFADTYSSTGNGAVVRMSDGTRIEYNARGSSITIKELFYTPSSSGSSRSNVYYGSEIDDCYWGASTSHYIAHWDADYQSKAKYTVTLYRDGHKVTSKTSKGGKSMDFTEAIANANKSGSYYFTVKASWGSGITDENESDYVYIDTSDLNRIRSSSSSSSPGVYATNGWELINGKWYYFDGAGNMAANQWVQTDAWYYVGSDGDMLVNEWIQSRTDSHIWYYVGGDGRMVTNTVINGWPINAAGECYF